MRKKITSLFLSVLIMLSVATATSFTVYATDSPDKATDGQPITLQFKDGNTGNTITPDLVTVNSDNDGIIIDTFIRLKIIQFVPTYYQKEGLPSAYSIKVQATGYDELVIPGAFIYNKIISSGLNNEHIAITGNTITVTLKKQLPEPTPSLLKNADFEQIGLPNWYRRGSNPNNIMLTNAQHRSGGYSLYMFFSQNEPFNNHIDQACPITKSGYYKFSAYIKTDAMLSGAGAMLMLEARDANGIMLVNSSSAVLSNTNGGWQRLSMQMYAPPGTATLVAKIGGVYCTGGFFVDDAELVMI